MGGAFMNEAERGAKYLAINRARIFSPRIRLQLQRARPEHATEGFRLLACVEAAQELRLGVLLTIFDEGFVASLSNIDGRTVADKEGATNSDAILLALADALGVEVPA